MNAIRLRFSRSFYIRHSIVGGLSLLIGLMLCLVLGQLGPLRWMAPALLTFPWLFFFLREKRLAVREIDDKGVIRGDGRRFLWNDFVRLQEVHTILQSGQQGALNHVDLHFGGGRARLLVMSLENAGEAIRFARARTTADTVSARSL